MIGGTWRPSPRPERKGSRSGSAQETGFLLISAGTRPCGLQIKDHSASPAGMSAVLCLTLCLYLLLISTFTSAADLTPSGVYLRLAQSVEVGDVDGVSGGGRVHASRASLLEPQVFQDAFEARVLDHKHPTNSQNRFFFPHGRTTFCVVEVELRVSSNTLLRMGRRMCTPALRPVPRLEGQVRT